ncbi:MAG: methyl-accepting chemotaxis protein [Acidobacteriota bacterium]
MKFNIKVKLFSGFLLLLIVGSLISLLTLTLLTSAYNILEDALIINSAVETRAVAAKHVLLVTANQVNNQILNGVDTSLGEKRNPIQQEFFANIAEIKRIAKEGEISGLIDQAEEVQRKTLLRIENEIVTALRSNKPDTALPLFNQQYLPALHQQEKLFDKIIIISAAQKDELLVASRKQSSNVRTLTWLCICGFFAGGLTISYLLAKSLALPIIRLAEHLKRAAKGDLVDNYRYDVRVDEIGELSRSLNSFYDYIREMAVVASKIARGNLTVQVKPRSAVDGFGNAFNIMIANLQHSIADLRNTSDQLARTSSELAAASVQASKLNEMASCSTEETTAAMHQMSASIQNVVNSTHSQQAFVTETSTRIGQMINSIQHVASMAKKMLTIAEKSSQEASSGVVAMGKNIDGISKINDSIRHTADTIEALEVRTANIGKIVDVIAYVADQTNLLSLNAAIEAARAGEHGLGFAVVAEEVRKLAERSAKSTKEIDEIIKGIRKEVGQVAKEMTASQDIVSQVTLQAEEVTTALKRVEQSVFEVCRYSQEIGVVTSQQNAESDHMRQATVKLNELAQEIWAAAEEQASGAGQVVHSVELLRDVIDQNAQSSTKLAASGEQLAHQSETLLDVVGRFRFENENDNNITSIDQLADNQIIVAGLPATSL